MTTHGVKQMTRALEELGTGLGHQDHGPAQPYVDHQGTAWRFEARVHVFSRRPQAVRKNPLAPKRR